MIVIDGVEFAQFDSEEDVLEHYGVIRRSGRYPWGSSGNESGTQRNPDLLSQVDALKRQKMSEAQIAKALGLESTTQLRALKSIAKNEERAAKQRYIQYLRDEKQMSNNAISKQLGIPESTIRSLMDPTVQDRTNVLMSTANMLRSDLSDKGGYLDIGAGTENHLGISKDKLRTAVTVLQEEEGYKVYYVKVQQLGTGKETTVKVLAPPDATYAEVYKNAENIRMISSHSPDMGRTYEGLRPPQNVSSKRIQVKYAEEGGTDKDGVMEIRRGVEDLSLGNMRYAQVRIAVDGTHYLKGMAVYADDLPPGVDIRFNTNKNNTGNKLDALKKMKTNADGSVDEDNPFGASIKPGGQRGALNIINEEGDWSDWSRNLPSQMLSKQSPALAKKQLDLTYQSKKDEYDEINALTNPTVKRKMLEEFAESADSSAVHLKAAAMPRQGTHVIIPMSSIKENEIYAPNFRDGETVALVRFPHGGKFEIPELRVNNKLPEGNNIIPQALDAVGIHSKTAARLSGADFDGDTVLVIPNNGSNTTKAIKTSKPLEGLKDFDPQRAYPAYEGMKPMSARTKQLKMGDVSNLITDMTLQGASESELARAVKHSMVVIDAEKHNLNYKQSEIDQGIKDLKTKYQGSARAGASTLISRASSEVRVGERALRRASEGGPVDPETGEKVYTYTNATYTDRNGKEVLKTTKSTKMAEAKDARTLVSKAGTEMEMIYADHANRLKAISNQARKEALSIKDNKYDASAKKTYQKEVDSLNSKLNVALKNAPVERQAQLLANSIVATKKAANPNMDPADEKKVRNQALAEARVRTGAGKQRVEINWDEWNAIQAGAISPSKLKTILDNADMDKVKQMATPRERTVMTDAKIRRAKAMLATGYNQSDIAAALGVAPSTLKSALS